MKNYSKKIYSSIILFLSLGLGIAGAFYYQPQMLSNSPFLQQLLEKFVTYQEETKEEKVYLHLDRKYYEPSENIWFSAYVRDAQTFQKSTQSGVVYVELLDPKGSKIKELTLLTENGKANGDFQLEEHLKGGLYKIKAYTKWQQNTNSFFEQDITVQKAVLPNLNMQLNFDRKAYGAGSEVEAILDLNTLTNTPLAQQVFTAVYSLNGEQIKKFDAKTDDNGRAKVIFRLPKNLNTNDGLLNIMIAYKGQTESISRSIPINLGNIDLQFYPEGGELIEGMIGGIGFKALDEFGKAADIAGKVYDENDRVVATIASYHQGMGRFELAPQPNMKYFVKLTSPSGASNKIYELPKALRKGYTLKIEKQTKTKLEVGVVSSEVEKLYLVAQSRHKIFFSKEIEAQSGINNLQIPTQDFPIGITQLTLFDSKKIAQAERLVFVNPHKQLNIKVNTNKEKYLPREKVEMELEVTDERGIAVQTSLSLAVVDDKLLSFADDKQGHILSYMLLESDLVGEIEEPNFYFDKKDDPTRLKPEIDRQLALDNLLMTQGWRKFEWQKIIADNYTLPSIANEPALLAGTIQDKKGNPLQGATVQIIDTESKAFTNKEGTFGLGDLPLYQAKQMQISLPGYFTANLAVAEYNANMNLVLYKEREIKGVVKDEKKKAVPFATVQVNGIAHTTADENGKFSIKIPENITLLYTQVIGYGYQSHTIPTGTDKMTLVLNTPIQQNKWGAKGGKKRRRAIPPPPIAPEVLEVEDMEMVEEMVLDAPADEIDLEEKIVAPVVEKQLEGVIIADQKEMLDDIVLGNVRADKKSRVAIKREAIARQNVLSQNLAQNFTYAWSTGLGKKTRYQRGRVYPIVNYEDTQTPTQRVDFRNTIYWNPSIETDQRGRASFSFYNSDAITQFSVTAEGFSQSGGIGRMEYKYFTQLPLEMTIKVPRQVLTGDILDLPLTLTNNTTTTLDGNLKVQMPDNIQLDNTPTTISLKANESKTVLLKAIVANTAEDGKITISCQANGMQDQFVTPIVVQPRGFPVTEVFAGSQLKNNFELTLQQPIAGTVIAKVQVYPSVLDEVLTGMESMLRMPGGCFEQTSSANYPNLLVLNYLKETNTSNLEIETRAKEYLKVGYNRLVGYESNGGGFDWWGRNPAHEALTAYGLMEFVDMQAVYPVDEKIITRASKWLLSRKDGKGGWNKNPNALHSWAVAEVTDAYIVWALSEAGYANEIQAEIDKSYKDAVKSEDPYMMALVANALFKAKDSRAEKLVKELVQLQQKEGTFLGLTSSVTNSTGHSLTIETTSLAALAMMQAGNYQSKVEKAVATISSGKTYYGYGSTQGTVLALKTLLEYAKNSKKVAKNGELVVYVDGKKATSLPYTAGQKEILLPNIATYLKEGKQQVSLQYENTDEALPLGLELTYTTRLPQNSVDCPFGLVTTLPAQKVKMGETIRLTTTLSNKTDKGQPMTMVMVGIPAGLSLQAWQLKELQEKGVFDYYELFEGYAVFHYEQIKAKDNKTIHLDLKADIPGTYEAPASSAFLYYTNEHKTWAMPEKMVIL